MSFLIRLKDWLIATLEPYGAPGLMLIAICDSSFLSLPEVNDAALMALSVANPANMWKLATMTVIGSIIGCTLLYTVGRKGGEALLLKRFAAPKVDRVRAWYGKYGMLAIIVPSLLPPPLPFKIFVLCAGAFKISWLKFMLAVGIGRSVRYFTEGYLAVRYGNQAMQIVKDNAGPVGIALAAIIIVGTLVFVYARRRASTPAILLPLLCVLTLSGCPVRTINTPEEQRIKTSHPFTRSQALERLRSLSVGIQTLQAKFGFSGYTPEQKGKDEVTKFENLTGDLAVERPGRIFMDVGLLGQGFEMKSDGERYEVYLSTYKQVHTGLENAPPSTSSCKLNPRATQFINIRPRQIMDAIVPDFLPLLDSPTVWASTYVIQDAKDQREYFIVDFHDVSVPTEPRILQKIYFDLSEDDVDMVRRMVFDRNGRPERDTLFSKHQNLGNERVRYPMRFDVQFVPMRTYLNISVTDPLKMVLNKDIDPEDFELGTHRNAEVCRMEPTLAVTQQ